MGGGARCQIDIIARVQSVNLGRTGLKVSRLCLGTMTYGSRKWRPWDQALVAVDIRLDEAEMKFLEEPYRPHAVIGHH